MNQPLPFPSRPAPAQAAPALLGWPVLRLGFRPFYIGAALLACLSLPLWMGMFVGHVPFAPSLPPMLWHAHEMLFGFAAAVIVGFLLTAVKAWTGLPTPRGAPLGALVLLWLAARLAAFGAPYAVYALLDVLLLPAVGVVLLRVLVAARNQRNVPLIGLLLVMTAANAAFHLAVMGVFDGAVALSALHAELGLVVMVVCVIAGRVVPLFTKNVTPGLVLSIPRRFELSLLAVTGATFVLWVCGALAWATAVAAGAAALLNGARLALWKPWVTLRRPILWILHLSYAWLPIGLALLALAQLGIVAPSLAVHALGVGVIGGLIIGMVTRTARGHTGRPLVASRAEVLAYVMVLAAALLRVAVPAVAPAATMQALLAATCLWSGAFAIYLVIYTPWLMRTRLDGKDG